MMSHYHKFQVHHAVAWTVVLTAMHFVIGTRSPSLHWVHVLLAGFYLVPIMIASVAFERRGGLVASAGVSLAYLAHLMLSWDDSPMANLDQYAWFGVYPIVGVVSGHLVHTANYRKKQRDEIIARSQHAEMINGITGLMIALSVRDAATVEHSRRVADFAAAIGTELGYDEQVLSNLRLAALVHDIGKAGIPDAILFKHGPLDTEQMDAMREHVDIAVAMLREIPGTDEIARLVAQHHECPDGTGYPRGLTGEESDPVAAVLRVADVYTALTESRPYHDAMSEANALHEMETMVGAKLDDAVFAALRRVLRDGLVGAVPSTDHEPAGDSI